MAGSQNHAAIMFKHMPERPGHLSILQSFTGAFLAFAGATLASASLLPWRSELPKAAAAAPTATPMAAALAIF